MKNSLVLVFCVLLLNACNFNNEEKNAQTIPVAKLEHEASLRFNWLTTCSYAGDVAGAEKFAKGNDLNLRLDKGGIGVDPMKLVQAGENTFGEAGADLVLMANDKGADFVIIGLVNYNSPGVWVSKKEKHIQTIEGIKPSTRIGELPGGNMIYLYEVFLKKAGLERNKDFNPVSIPFELKGFIQGDECDLRPVFNYEVLPELDMLGIEYNVIEPKDIGVEFKGLAYFCKRETVENNPELVQSFVNTLIEGWTFALNNKEASIDLLKEFDGSVNKERELLGLKVGEDYFDGYQGKLLYSDNDSWNVMITDMRQLGFLKKDVDLRRVLDLSFVEKYYNEQSDAQVN